MKQRPFQQIDVFTDTPYLGNPLAVVLDASGLDDARMQDFARWTNLSETTFVLPPTQTGADYKVRIFTPGGELPFAGHPTLGTCHAWLAAGGRPRSAGEVVQECGVGLVRISREGARLAFAAPPLRRTDPSPAVLAQVAAALGLQARQIVAAQNLDNGPLWLSLLLDSAQTVLALEPDHVALRQIGVKVGVAGLTGNVSTGSAMPALEVRAFAAPIGVPEDPVTGSLNAGLAQWLIAEGHLPQSYTAAQGARLGRAGRVRVRRDADGTHWIGGDSVTCVQGEVLL